MIEMLEKALKSTDIPFAHYGWDKAPSGDYGVWAEDSAKHFYGNNHVDTQTTQGTIDLFTRTDGKEKIEQIQSVLNSLDIAWYLSSIQYESDTRYLHYEWVFEVA